MKRNRHYIKPVGKTAGILLVLFALLACLAGAGHYIYISRDSYRVHTAADFGFADLKSVYDADGDGTDDWTDLVLGAREYIETDPVYKSGYYSGGYPDAGEGVCTDVIWHAFQAAGYCLKDMVDADISANRALYEKESGKVGDSNIDFRRVRNLLVFFRRHAQVLTTSLENPEDWMPGDIVVFDGHIAICSDMRNANGIPYIIHHGNVTDGAVEEDGIGSYKIVAHFRYIPDINNG